VAEESIELREGNLRLPSGGRIKKICENTLLSLSDISS
jgi:hypothetical protein